MLMTGSPVKLKYYMYVQEKVLGPYTPEEILKQFGGVAPETLICATKKFQGGSAKWRPVTHFPELAACVKKEISEPLPVTEQPSAARRQPLKILSSDDDANIRELLWHILEEAGHKVEFARDGEEVLKRLGEQAYDLVILDVNMPKMNGYKVSEVMHKKMANPPKVIIFTGRDLQKERLQFVCSGADAILGKGVDNDKLVRTIEELFPAPRPAAASSGADPAAGAGTLNVPVLSVKEPGAAQPAAAAVNRPSSGPAGADAAEKNGAQAEPQGRSAKAAAPAAIVDAAIAAVSKAPAASVPSADPGNAPAARPQAEDLPRREPAAGKTPGNGKPAADGFSDMNMLMGHIDLECARLEMQFERHALKLIEMNRETARKMQADWRRTRHFIMLTAFLLLASVLMTVILK